ncbi:hypothetical protein WDU94_002069 [Cyamophila willieti]
MPEARMNWSEEVERENEYGELPSLPPPVEEFDKEKGLKIVTEYRYDSNDKKTKVVRTLKVEKKLVSKGIASRKHLAKYGKSANDKPGPQSNTTIIGEEVHIQFISNKEEVEKPEEENLEKLKFISCRMCKGTHFTNNCPFKDSAMFLQAEAGKKAFNTVPGTNILAPSSADDKKPGGPGTPGGPSSYVPPALRDGGKRGVEGGYNARRNDDTTAIRISNLSVNTSENDLEDLVKQFGPTSKMYLSRDKTNGLCKGFAYIHFKNKADAAKAIQYLNGYGYDHLILSVDWSKSTNQ